MPTITYRTGGDWGAGKGGNLTPAEVDTNFYEIAQALGALDTGPTPAEIDNITLVGNQLTFILDDARTFGPYTIPRAAFNSRGAWTAATIYNGNDVVQVAGEGLFLVLVTHTSPATFNAAHQASGQNAYQLMLEEVRYSFSFEGVWAVSTAYSVNDVVSVEADGIYLVLQDHTSSEFGFNAADLIGGLPVYQLMYAEPRSAVVTVDTTTFTPSTIWGYHRCTNVTGCVVTIPANADAPFPVGTEFHFRQSNSGTVSIAGAAGVTLNIPAGVEPETGAFGAVFTAKKVAINEWDVFGLLAETVV